MNKSGLSKLYEPLFSLLPQEHREPLNATAAAAFAEQPRTWGLQLVVMTDESACQVREAATGQQGQELGLHSFTSRFIT